MGRELARKDVPAPRRFRTLNTMTFPSELREAIPTLPTCSGRILQLSSTSGDASNSPLFGPRAHLKLVVNETGKLTGEFTVRLDLQAEAARALAATLTELANRAEKSAGG